MRLDAKKVNDDLLNLYNSLFNALWASRTSDVQGMPSQQPQKAKIKKGKQDG